MLLWSATMHELALHYLLEYFVDVVVTTAPPPPHTVGKRPLVHIIMDHHHPPSMTFGCSRKIIACLPIEHLGYLPLILPTMMSHSRPCLDLHPNNNYDDNNYQEDISRATLNVMMMMMIIMMSFQHQQHWMPTLSRRADGKVYLPRMAVYLLGRSREKFLRTDPTLPPLVLPRLPPPLVTDDDEVAWHLQPCQGRYLAFRTIPHTAISWIEH
jgi:hypothetical protein